MGRHYLVPLRLVLAVDKVSTQRFDVVVMGMCGSVVVVSTLPLCCPCRRLGVACCSLTNILCFRFHFRPGHAFVRSFIHGQARYPAWCGAVPGRGCQLFRLLAFFLLRHVPGGLFAVSHCPTTLHYRTSQIAPHFTTAATRILRLLPDYCIIA